MRKYARACGLFYLLIFAAAIPGEILVTGNLVVDGNPSATVARILGSPYLWRAGYSAQMLTMVLDVAIAWLLYVLLAHVNRRIAVLAAFFRLTYVAIYSVAVLANVVALPMAERHLVTAVDFALRVHNEAFALSLIFFGVNLALVGYLIARAPVKVRWLAVALLVSGACYILNSATIFAYPPLHSALFPWILLPPFVGEVGLTLWLLVTKRFD